MKIITIILAALLILSAAKADTNPPPNTNIVMSDSIPATQLPPEAPMNKDAGRGNEIFVTLQLANGKNLPFLIDTGASTTVMDKSLEPLLGKRLSSGEIHLFGAGQEADSYFAPALYLANTPLMMTGPYVTVIDCSMMSRDSARPVMGILGMDVLRHYCIQLDFAANKIRFLDSKTADRGGWGKAFPLFDIGDGCCYISQDLVDTEGRGSLIDTGCDYDGWLEPDLYRQWTNQAPFTTNGETYTHYGVLDGEVYHPLNLRGLDPKLQLSGDMHLTLNGIGLEFLSRNLVTLDFPEQNLYLKRVTAGYFVDKNMRATAKAEGKSAYKFLKRLMSKGQLPGWSKGDDIATMTTHFQYPDVVTFDLIKRWDSSVFHYQVIRTVKDGPWQLVKAWHADARGTILTEYPVSVN